MFKHLYRDIQRGRGSLSLRAPDSCSKGCMFESRQKRWENFLLQNLLCVLTLIRCPFHSRATAVARKRPRLFCQKYKWQDTRTHAHTLHLKKSEWTDYAGHSGGTYPETSSHAACQGTFGHSRLSSLSHCGLILT